MPHLMNCSHSSDGWCLDCVKELHDQHEECVTDAGKWDYALGAASQRLQAALPIGQVKSIGHMDVPAGIDCLIEEITALKAALRLARKYAVNRQELHPIGLREFAAACGVSPTVMSEWTADPINTPPDLF